MNRALFEGPTKLTLGILLLCDRTLEARVTATCADGDTDSALGAHPRLTNDIPDGEVVARQGEADSRTRTGREENIVEPAKDGRRLLGRLRVVQVELHDLGKTMVFSHVVFIEDGIPYLSTINAT